MTVETLAQRPELDLEAGRRLFAAPVRYVLSVARLDQLPEVGLPEIAFAGRSNVGKSSLLNALVGRSGLARTSHTPGRTQELVFFELGGRLLLVDMPGYGYARAPKAKVETWTKLIFAYLRGRPSLALVCLLIDARHGPKPNDERAMNLLAEAAVPYLVVLTKADLVRPSELAERVADLRRALLRRPAALPEPIVTSAKDRRGLELLRAELAARAAPEPRS
ncbi:MAG: ribosome biogenesis GTP-binding protein YihA/YsxC [Geminicoccaceae bacterium]|nr:ribosome biogenesis GTP-binding protein YihA/YsxC [Geminicoccaceae bacterium]MCS7267893.1 ribosome biogenesis GTP-binding protein YihA/YsxC [Geminicoccaceae bacterium]MDW8124477.1 ribosome biogenesis GTP-binding protein YihA/YsxC [Geminicoccaceae bacterium]MDW8342593.1 ribosome biogenesis GTP-binding protein YihA/YsxC [Geminicoccaceae bacterium]